MPPSIFGACPKPGKIGRVAAEKASGVKLRGGGIDGPGGVASSQHLPLLSSPPLLKYRMMTDHLAPKSMISGVSGCRYLLVPAHPGSPGQKAVKRQ